MSLYGSPYPDYGLEPQVIEAAMRKARRERSEALWSMIAGIFDRKATDEEAVDENSHKGSDLLGCAGTAR
jgi:hypothetical protein